MSAPAQLNIVEALEKMRTEIIVAHSKSEQSSLNGFDVLINQLKNYSKIAIDLRTENKRLQELCEKNNIAYKQKGKAVKPTPKVTP